MILKLFEYLKKNFNLVCYCFLWGFAYFLLFYSFFESSVNLSISIGFLGGFFTTLIYEKKRKDKNFLLDFNFLFKKSQIELDEKGKSKKFNFFAEFLFILGFLMILLFLLFFLYKIFSVWHIINEPPGIFLLIFSYILLILTIILLIYRENRAAEQKRREK